MPRVISSAQTFISKFIIPVALILNYLREVRVPWRHIIYVSGSRWVNTRQVTVTFDRDIGFGTSIIFMPRVRFLWPGQEHPIAEELRQLIKK